MTAKSLFILIGVVLVSIVEPGLAQAEQTTRVGNQAPMPTPTPPPTSDPPGKLATSNIDLDSAKTSWSQIGLLKKGEGSCPDDIPGWTSERLDELALRRIDEKYRDPTQAAVEVRSDGPPAFDRKSEDLFRKTALDRICIFTQENRLLKFPQELPPGLVETQPDRIALTTPAVGGDPSDQLSKLIRKELEKNLLDQSLGFLPGSTGPKRLQLDVSPGGPPSVRIVFIDSQEDAKGDDTAARPTTPAPGASLHGYTLNHLARKVIGPLVCPTSGQCIQITNSRVLHHDNRRGTPEVPRKQSLGLVSDLAAAILGEVLYWRDQPEKERPRHLILNLSLGWDGELFGDLKARKPSQLDLSVQAVYEALRFAARNDVLVIAAAGNVRSGPQESDAPLLPAAWEHIRPSWFPFVFGRKKIHGVGGVDWQGLPLPNSRLGGRPRLSVFGDHAVVETGPDPDDFTAIYTGTSVSAAVTSSIASVVWHLRPDLRPRQLMRLITKSGELLGTRADCYSWKKLWPLFWLKGPHTRQASLCGAVEWACGPRGRACPALKDVPDCKQPRESPHLVESITPALDKALLIPMDTFTLRNPPAPPCHSGGQLLTTTATENDPPCPADQFGDTESQRWVAPQPSDTPCPGCALIPPPPTGSGAALQEFRLVLQIDPTWIGNPTAKIHSAVLTIKRSGGVADKISYAIPVPNDALLHPIILDARGTPLKDCTAILDFVVTVDGKHFSISNPVKVDAGTR